MSSDDEPRLPEPGAGSTKDPPPALETDSDSDDDLGMKKKPRKVVNVKKGYKRPRVAWREVLYFVKGDEAQYSEEEMKRQMDQAIHKIMEDSRLVMLPGHVAKPTDVGLWKLKKAWTMDSGRTHAQCLHCPMQYRFGCTCQLRMFDGPSYMCLEIRGEHNPDSHAPEKEISKHLTVKQQHAIQTGVRISPGLSARSLRRNLANFSPEKQIDPLKIRNVKRKVAKCRADLTLEQLDQCKVDDSFGSLSAFSDAKWFATLIAQHNDKDSDFHFSLFEPFVIGRDLNAADDIVYLNLSSIWHLCNFLRNIAAGWVFQINGDATYKVCRRAVALYCMGVNSVPHVNNPVCFAIMPETESKELIHGTWCAVQEAAMMMMKQITLCDDATCPVWRRVQHYQGLAELHTCPGLYKN
jgi:hypothetical protein